MSLSNQSLPVAYLTSIFPKVSETFVIDEIAEMTRQGVDVSVFPLRRGTEAVLHDAVLEHMDRVYFTPYLSRKIAAAH